MESTPGGRLEEARVRLGLSVPQLARRIGVKRKTLENWENDRSGPRAEKLLKLAGVLQVPFVWLLTGDMPQGPQRHTAVRDTAMIAQRIERAIALQQDVTALLFEASTDVSRLQRELDEVRKDAV